MPVFDNRGCRWLLALALSVGGLLVTLPGAAQLVSAVLPTTRSVAVAQPATVFATLINSHAVSVTGCAPGAPRGFPGTFSYQTTDPGSNQPVGIANRPVDLDAGAAQSFLLVLTPTVSFASRSLEIPFTCDDVAPTEAVQGINTLTMSASNTPGPDMVALSAASAGTLELGAGNGIGAFAVASVNVGAAGAVQVSADLADRQLPVGLSLCQTDSAARCINPATPSAEPVTLQSESGSTATFSVFANSSDAVDFDPANHRVFVRFADMGGAPRGATSVALRRPADAQHSDQQLARINKTNMPTFAEALRGFASEGSLELDGLVEGLFESQIPVFNLADAYRETRLCPGGRVSVTISEGGANTNIYFNECQIDGVQSLGRIILAFSNVSGAGTDVGGYDLRVTYEDFALSSASVTEIRNGTVQVRTDINGSEHRHVSTLELEADISGTDFQYVLRAEPLTLEIAHERDSEAFDWLAASGQIWVQGEGRVNIDHVAGRTTPGEILFQAAPGTVQAMTQTRADGYSLSFQPAGKSGFSARYDNGQMERLSRFDGQQRRPDSRYIAPRQLEIGEVGEADLLGTGFDQNADFVVGTATLIRGDARHIKLRRLSSTRFEVQASAAGYFEFRINVTDPLGKTDETYWGVQVVGDTDGDGTLDRFDQDDDADGVLDTQDPFPVEGDEWLDTDGDDVGDNSDADDDNDGVLDINDDYPRDAACQSHTTQPQCLAAAIARVDQIAWNDTELFFAVFGEDRIYRFGIADDAFLGVIDVRPAREFFTSMNKMIWQPEHQRLYAGFTDGRLFALNPATLPVNQQLFFFIGAPLVDLVSAGSQVLAISGLHPRLETAKSIAADGVQTQEFAFSGRRGFAFDGPNRVLFAVSSSLQSLRFGNDGRFNDFQSQSLRGFTNDKFALDPATSRIILGNGAVYDRETFAWQNGIDGDLKALGWADGLPLIVVREEQDGFRLTEYGTDLRTHNTLNLGDQSSGATDVFGIVPAGDHYLLLLRTPTSVDRIRYFPSDDSDGDGVENNVDAFPEDSAASVDADNDGAPDAWLPGQSAATSTTGLVLDAFPSEPGCWLATHSTNGVCDIGKALPAYVPELISSDSSGVLYLFDRTDGTLYRYNAITRSHLLPVRGALGRGSAAVVPYSFAVHEGHQRLYFGNNRGWVNQLSLSDPGGTQTRFANQTSLVGTLLATGSNLLVQDFSGAWASHFYYTEGGELVDSAEWRYESETHAYAPTQRRVYSLWDLASPTAGLRYEQLTADGMIDGKVDSDELEGQHPVVLAPDESIVLDGAGRVFSTIDLRLLTPLANSFVDAAWNADGELLAVREDGESTLLDRYDLNRTLIDSTSYTGVPLALEATPAGVVLVSLQDGRPIFTQLP